MTTLYIEMHPQLALDQPLIPQTGTQLTHQLDGTHTHHRQ